MSPLNISLDPIKVPGILSAKIWINGGSRTDPAGKKGAHQLLGSVISRGCGPYSNNELADLVEGCGAGLRCDTFEEGLLISLKCSESDSDRLLPLMGWMITDPHLESDQIKLERELSLQALQRQKENPFQLSFDGWRQLAYQDGPYGHDPLGLAEDIETIDQEELFPLAKRLVEEDQILAIAGTCPDDLNERIMEMEPFKKLLSTNKNQSALTRRKELFTTSTNKNATLSLQSESTEQVVIMLGQPTIPHGHKDDLALRLLSCHLGSGMSSILFTELREKHGVAYDVGIHHPVREGEAPFLMHASTSEEKASMTLQFLQKIWSDIERKLLSKDELNLARSKFRGQIAHGSQTVGQRAERRAQLRWLHLGDNYDIQCLDAIESITSQNLQDIAYKYLKAPLLSLCGPEDTIKKLSESWHH